VFGARAGGGGGGGSDGGGDDDGVYVYVIGSAGP